ncbi:MAG: hypothetical protein QNJ90_03970 [Planctomycetota bacterium]|nr:hypothetical protein [Planctomycetota bacterium]
MTWVDVTIAEVIQETPLDRSFVLRVPAEHVPAFAFTAGQYVRLRDPADAEERDWYFSLSAAPNAEGTLRVTVRGRGDAVQGMYAAEAGTAWRAAPPEGDFRFEAQPGERIVLAGAGSGVTPFRAYVETRADTGDADGVWLLHSARGADELLFHAEFTRWSEAWDAFTYVPTVTGDAEAWTGRRGRIDADLLREALGDVASVRIYACGPPPFVNEVLAAAAELGVAPERCCRQ